MPREYIVLVAGPMGAGKTTAIAALSEIPVVLTEAVNTDQARHAKATTTVALDYGEISLGDGDKVRLYGVPGQDRFDFMWRILEKRSLGMMLLIDNGATDPLSDLERYLHHFDTLGARSALVVGVTRRDQGGTPPMEAYHARLGRLGRVLPVFSVDARNAAQVRTMLGALIAMVEAKAAARAHAGAVA
ncbi:GTP-binding protein [Lysobacter silvisoli]|uniref:ATP-binding protein n=1 Tax=Lysobacter silvisoli TaxID=2293254 RepID=A0A371JYH1_9GAMM|nr:ATP/GTP-binding protein [Lysobacter silvisoli]RDZ26713.1 ATP-binding protein [Lysobacter silvisoli]